MIDTTFDFTTDTLGYWDGFWDRNDGLGGGGADPDSKSPTLRQYHQMLWSKELPNGDLMDLKPGGSRSYLSWRNFEFSSDSIIVELRYYRNIPIFEKVKERVGDYQKYYEDLIRKSYTIGGMMIFPKHPGSINQAKGTNAKLRDRWDLTLECIRRYYHGENSPIHQTLLRDKEFFDLFVDFRGYVDYFFLQDCVSNDYSAVNFWLGNGDFEADPLPQSVEEYLHWIDSQMTFLQKRNRRIAEVYG